MKHFILVAGLLLAACARSPNVIAQAVRETQSAGTAVPTYTRDATYTAALPTHTLVAPTDTPVPPADTAIPPTDTQAPPSATQAADSTPFAAAPLCLSHDETAWHSLWDAARACHYDHTHNADPALGDAVFGPAAYAGGQTTTAPDAVAGVVWVMGCWWE